MIDIIPYGDYYWAVGLPKGSLNDLPKEPYDQPKHRDVYEDR